MNFHIADLLQNNPSGASRRTIARETIPDTTTCGEGRRPVGE
jgi:hypothetical protein